MQYCNQYFNCRMSPLTSRRPMTGTLPADEILRTAAGLSPTAFAAAALPVSSPFLISRSIDAAALQRVAPFDLPQEQSVRSASDQVGYFAPCAESLPCCAEALLRSASAHTMQSLPCVQMGVVTNRLADEHTHVAVGQHHLGRLIMLSNVHSGQTATL